MSDPTSNSDLDATLIEIIRAPLRADETAVEGFARKEREMCEVLVTQPVLAARSLHARLANPRDGDALAAAFMRLTPERRVRVLSFLADARRREALARHERATSTRS